MKLQQSTYFLTKIAHLPVQFAGGIYLRSRGGDRLFCPAYPLDRILLPLRGIEWCMSLGFSPTSFDFHIFSFITRTVNGGILIIQLNRNIHVRGS
jgi:hypothetical protein